MALSISSPSIFRPTSEISTSNILNYKRRSKLVSYNTSNNTINTHNYNNNNKSVNKIDTLKNCYNTLFDLKNNLYDHITMVSKENRKFTKGESLFLNKLIEMSKTEILSAYNICKKSKSDIKCLPKDKRTENKIIKDINNITDILYLLYNEFVLNSV